MYESVDDLTVVWMGQGVELATRMLALADEFDAQYGPAYGHAAGVIREVIRCDYDPLRPATTPLKLAPPDAKPEPGA